MCKPITYNNTLSRCLIPTQYQQPRDKLAHVRINYILIAYTVVTRCSLRNKTKRLVCIIVLMSVV